MEKSSNSFYWRRHNPQIRNVLPFCWPHSATCHRLCQVVNLERKEETGIVAHGLQLGNNAKQAQREYSALTEDEAADSISCHANILECTQNVDFLVGQHNAGLCGVFNGELGFATLAGDTTNGTREMFARKRLDWGLGAGEVKELKGRGVLAWPPAVELKLAKIQTHHQ